MIRRILVPLDGTAMAEAVLPAVRFLVKQGLNHIALLHVLETEGPETVHGQRHLTDEIKAEQYLKTVAASLLSLGVGVDVHVHIFDNGSSIAHQMQQHAREFDSELVVICSHGSDWQRDLAQGNIAQQALMDGATPVLLCRWNRMLSGLFPLRRY